jgi:hypothetical protein
MKRAAIPFAVAITVASGIALAQGTDDPMAQLRVCSVMERAERLDCLDKVSRSMPPERRQAGKTDNWIVSETTSPVDYSPIAAATTLSRDGPSESAMRLSIRCRGGRTELVVAGPSAIGIGDDYTISYRVNGGQWVQIAAAVAASRAGIAFGGDVVRLLQSLPDSGSLSIHVASRTGTALDGTFSLVGLDAVRTKMVAACRWPLPVANPTGAGVR